MSCRLIPPIQARCSPNLWNWSVICLLISGCAQQESYPNAPITMIVPWGVGGGTDRVSRQMARFLEEELHVPVNVVNATGGRGVTGHSRGLHARPDGYTITMMTLELNMLHWQDLTEISWKEGIPLMSVNEDAAAVFVREDSPWKTLADLIAAVKENPGKLTASGTASGGAWHLATSVWLEAAGLDPADVKWIPMNGSSASLQELLSNGLDFVCCSLPEAKTQLESKQVRSLGVMSTDRAPGFESVPTFPEQGLNVTLIGWRGFSVPVGTPAERVDRLATAMERIVRGETTIERKTFPAFLEGQGFNARWRKTDDFTRFLADNDAAFGRIYQNPKMVQDTGGRISPWAFPELLIAAAGILLVFLGIGRWRNQRTANAEAPIENTTQAPEELSGKATWKAAVSVVAVVASVIAFMTLTESLGFLIVTGVGFLGMMLLLGGRPLSSLLATGLVVPAIYHVFAHLLSVPLPRGLMGW